MLIRLAHIELEFVLRLFVEIEVKVLLPLRFFEFFQLSHHLHRCHVFIWHRLLFHRLAKMVNACLVFEIGIHLESIVDVTKARVVDAQIKVVAVRLLLENDDMIADSQLMVEQTTQALFLVNDAVIS